MKNRFRAIFLWYLRFFFFSYSKPMRSYPNDTFARFKVKFYVMVVTFARSGVFIPYGVVYVSMRHCVS